MNKTLALIAALGLVVAAPAFAAEEAVTKETTATEKMVKEAPAAGTTEVKAEEKTEEKK